MIITHKIKWEKCLSHKIWSAIEELFESINYEKVLSVKSELLYAPI